MSAPVGDHVRPPEPVEWVDLTPDDGGPEAPPRPLGPWDLAPAFVGAGLLALFLAAMIATAVSARSLAEGQRAAESVTYTIVQVDRNGNKTTWTGATGVHSYIDAVTFIDSHGERVTAKGGAISITEEGSDGTP